MSSSNTQSARWLISTDLHLSDRAKDSHRFGIFSWLAKQQEKYHPEATFILGDITEHKDNHSSSLVNKIIDELIQLQPPVYILRGNHDGVDPDNPFFKFLNCIEGIEFIVEPRIVPGPGRVAMIPHCRTQEQFNLFCSNMPREPEALMLHNTFQGALSEANNTPLNGLGYAPIEAMQPRACYAGDVHKPQQCGPVIYVGAPYHCRFGDQFEPRVLLANAAGMQNLYFPAPRKLVLRIRDGSEIESQARRGDQVKLIIELAREEATEWAQHKQCCLEECKALGLEVFGVDVDIKSATRKSAPKEQKQGQTPDQIFESFCSVEGVPSQIKKAGKELLK